jgi:hypothetical protein
MHTVARWPNFLKMAGKFGGRKMAKSQLFIYLFKCSGYFGRKGSKQSGNSENAPVGRMNE